MWPFGDKPKPANAARNAPRGDGSGGPTNEVVQVLNGMRHRRMGGGDIVVSELGLGTQRWGSADFNGAGQRPRTREETRPRVLCVWGKTSVTRRSNVKRGTFSACARLPRAAFFFPALNLLSVLCVVGYEYSTQSA